MDDVGTCIGFKCNKELKELNNINLVYDLDANSN